ncbi:MAG TPA: DUF4394 domain-containing protein [Candidatus Saccharimonadales bacterium]|nr:DUF4394 domain-containing protein [Candidatus Saccharimonadales bacterium]
MRRTAIALTAALSLAAAIAGPVSAAHLTPLVGLTTDSSLVTFTPATACQPSPAVRITGLQPGESIVAIDERPATGGLYGLGSSSRIYRLDAATGAATAVGSGPFAPALSGSSFGFDFNPTVDRIRIVSDTGQNLRAHPDTGAVAFVDGTLAYAAADPNGGDDPSVVAAAYTNPDTDPNTATTLYDLDAGPDRLVTQAPPNDGLLNTIGRTVPVQGLTGFDIAPGNTAFTAYKAAGGTRGCGPSTLATIDLATGTIAMTWSVGTKTPLRGVAVDLP